MKFLITLVMTTVIIWMAGTWALEVLPSYFRETILLLSVTTGGLYYFLAGLNVTPSTFVILYLATLVIKLMAFGAYIFMVVLDDASGAVGNAVFFMISYLIFTSLEVVFLYAKLAGKSR